MKRFNYLLGMLAVAATFTACSSDDVVQKNDDGITGKAYMTVSIVSNNAGTRAIAQNDFDTETDAENTVKNVTFFFYDNSGNYITKGKTVSSMGNYSGPAADATTNNIARIYDAVVALESSEKNLSVKKVLAVANTDASAFEGKSLAEAKALTSDNVGDASNGFIMTNSVHNSNVDDSGAATITTNQLFDSEEEAKQGNNPVDIYIERLAAKVTAKKAEGFSVAISDEDKATVDGATSLDVEIIAWGLNALEPTEYLIKNITKDGNYFSNAWTADGTTTNSWNDDDNHRCYWAEDPHYANIKYDTNGYVLANATDVHEPLTYVTYNSLEKATSPKPATMYCTENTYKDAGTNFADYKRASTSLLVIAQLKVNGSAQDLVKYNGTIYTVDSYKALVLQNGNVNAYYKKTTQNGKNTYTQIVQGDLSIPEKSEVITNASGDKATLVDGKVALQLDKTTDTWVIYNGTGDKDADASYTPATTNDVNAALASTDLQGYGFRGGRMYYSVPIKHLVNRSSSEDGSFGVPSGLGEYGVVRNHIYSIELSKITGIGHAIWNPDEHIVPTDETTYYLAAKLHILSWRIVPTQKVVLK